MPKHNLKVGDVVLVKVAGWGLHDKDVGKFAKVCGFDPSSYDDGVIVTPFEVPFEGVMNGLSLTVSAKSFGDEPVFYNLSYSDINAVELLPQSSVKQDVGKHYRYSFRLNLTQQDIANGYVMVNLDPYRISTVYNLGGWREHLVKKGIRGTEKGHTEKELLDELQCILDRAKQMYNESCIKDA